MKPEALIIGEVTIDENRLPDGRSVRSAGGAGTYCALTLQKLGMPSTTVSPYGEDFLEYKYPGMTLYPDKPTSENTLVFANSYDPKNPQLRTQKVRNNLRLFPYRIFALSDTIKMGKDIVIVAPLLPSLRLTDHRAVKHYFPDSIRILLPQGLFRSVRRDGTIGKRGWPDEKGSLPQYDLIILSQEDVVLDADTTARQWCMQGPVVIVTRADKGCTLYQKSKFSEGYDKKDYPAFRVDKIEDPTGAGDIFAAAFALAYYLTKNLDISINFGQAAAAYALRKGFYAVEYTRHNILSFANQQEVPIQLPYP